LSDEAREQKHRRTKDRAADAMRQAADDVRAVMSAGPGRRFVLRLLQSTVYGPSLGVDARSDAICGARKTVGEELLHDIQRAAPEYYALMETERLEEWRREALADVEPEAKAD
jgi:hypothetical protein